MPDSMPTGLTAPAPPGGDASLREWTVHHLQVQAVACKVLGSHLYARLLSEAADDVRRGGPTWYVLESHATTDTGAALALRFMAAVHRLVLTHRAPQLARHYASVGGTAGVEAAWPALRSLIVDRGDELRALVALPCQTNEVGRCAALIGGFLTAARSSSRYLRLLEIGASAGLNLRWDCFRYENTGDDRAWGDARSPVQLRGRWDVAPELLDQRVHVVARRGCDPRPVDPLSEEGRLTLTASVWGDQSARLARLRGAFAVAEQVAAGLDRARAVDWLPQHLRPEAGTATVVYHSAVLQYLDPQERSAVERIIADAGAGATPDASVHWVRMEPDDALRAMSVWLTSWPTGETRRLAAAGAHGEPVRWRA